MRVYTFLMNLDSAEPEKRACSVCEITLDKNTWRYFFPLFYKPLILHHYLIISQCKRALNRRFFLNNRHCILWK